MLAAGDIVPEWVTLDQQLFERPSGKSKQEVTRFDRWFVRLVAHSPGVLSSRGTGNWTDTFWDCPWFACAFSLEGEIISEDCLPSSFLLWL